MIAPPQIVLSPPRAVAVVPLRLHVAEIATQLDDAFRALHDTLAAQGVAPAGAPYTYHRGVHDDVADFDVGIPVAAPIVAAGRVVPATLRGARVAVATWRGPLDELGAAWESLGAWLALRGHVAAEDCWESYVGSADAPVTELHRPLAE